MSTARFTDVRRQLAAAGLTGIAYYVASLAGLALRLPGSTPSVIWPPNAVLTAVLLQTPRAWWPVCLLGALPAHLLVQSATGWPIALVLGFFVTNCSEALTGALLVRYLLQGPLRLDTLRGLAAFVGGVVVAAPVVSNFADAWLVHTFVGEPYWTVWTRRLSANVPSELIVVPAVLALPAVWRKASTTSPARLIEAATIAAGLAITAVVTISRVGALTPLHVVSVESPLTLTLPFLIWSAVRFGPHGAGLALGSTATITVLAAVNSLGPFRSVALTSELLPLQLSLALVSTTLLVLSTLVAERRGALLELTERVRLERFVTRLASAFVHVGQGGVQGTIDAWVPQVGAALDLEACALLDRGSNGRFEVIACWTTAAVDDAAFRSAMVDPQWLHGRLGDGRVIAAQPGEPPDARAADDLGVVRAIGLGALVATPMVFEDDVLGAIVCGSRHPLGPGVRVTLRLVADVLANAVSRKRSEEALRASELIKSTLLDSLPMAVAVIGGDGCVETANGAWAAAAAAGDPIAPSPGGHLAGACRALSEAGYGRFGEVAEAVDRAVAGSGGRATFERVAGPGPARWSSIAVVPVVREGGGAVVVATDVSELTHAELDAAQRLRELEQVTRIASLGELTATLAHQLNQPLTAIVANTATAKILIGHASRDDAGELPEILDDIDEAGRQASEIVRRVRELIHNRFVAPENIDLADALFKVAALVRAGADARRISLEVSVGDDALMVRGDGVLLQQVFLNLLINAVDAIRPEAVRRYVQVSACRGDDGVRVTVQDSGCGLGDTDPEMLFEPFFTTKTSGLGMGLAIAKSIVADHGGRVSARAGQLGGAEFEVWLPARSHGRDAAIAMRQVGR